MRPFRFPVRPTITSYGSWNRCLSGTPSGADRLFEKIVASLAPNNDWIHCKHAVLTNFFSLHSRMDPIKTGDAGG